MCLSKQKVTCWLFYLYGENFTHYCEIAIRNVTVSL